VPTPCRFARPAMIPAARATVTVLLALAGCHGGTTGSKVTLRYRPPAGATYRFALDQESSVRFAGGSMAGVPGQDIAMHIYYTQAVTGPSGAGIGVTVTFDSTTMVPGGMAPALDRLRGVSSKLVYDDRMRVVGAEFTGPEGEASPLTARMASSLKGMSFPLPDQPVGVGDSWTSETAMPLGDVVGASAPLKARTTLTVKQIQVAGSDTSIVLAIHTSFPGDPVTITLRGGTATLRLSGALDGEQLYSFARSVPVRSTRSGVMQIDVQPAQGGSEGMRMAMQQRVTLRLLDAR